MPALVALIFAAIGSGWLVARLSGSEAVAGFTAIDTRRVRLDGPAWVPPGWREWVGVRVAERGGLSSLDADAIRALVADIASMPNVLSVGEAKVVWPDGLSIEVSLRRPIACIRAGGEFLCVAADGVVLPGYWPAPPDTGEGFLPVIGPNDGALDDLAPGDALVEERHLDALSVALSSSEHLTAADRTALGPVLIDASHAASASVGEPGTRLYLEDRRLVLFGRPPRAGTPGELPEELKWEHLSRALALLQAEPPMDWDLVDLRWDRARVRPRSEAE